MIAGALSFDVEEWFQVQALAGVVRRDDWAALPGRVEASTHRLLDLCAAAGAKATFFTLGWVAERHPALVRRIVAEGHELASHGANHIRVFEQSPAQFRADIRRAKAVLEDVGGEAVRGYRAATFSIRADTAWAWSLLAEEGYGYSSSVYPLKRDLYGMPEAPRRPFRPVPELAELPLPVVRAAGRVWPCGGGGFFRLLPYAVTRALLRRFAAAEGPPIFYLHPWELDPGQPAVPGLSPKSRFRHRVNLGRTEARLKRLLGDFTWDRLDRVFL